MRVGIALAALCAVAVQCLAAGVADAPPNTWVKIEESETGGRHSPAFFHVPELQRFVVIAGVAHGPEQFVVEEFDPAADKWANAYPKGAPEGYQPEGGPTKAPPPRRIEEAEWFVRLVGSGQ